MKCCFVIVLIQWTLTYLKINSFSTIPFRSDQNFILWYFAKGNASVSRHVTDTDTRHLLIQKISHIFVYYSFFFLYIFYFTDSYRIQFRYIVPINDTVVTQIRRDSFVAPFLTYFLYRCKFVTHEFSTYCLFDC